MNTNSNFSTNEDGADNALTADLKAMEAELARQKELYLHLVADFDNFRKRTAQETDRRASAQKEAFILELLPTIDNLERALATKASASPQQLREGVLLTFQQLEQLLRRHGIEYEESFGQPFDPHRHEAVRTGCDPARPDHSVLEVFQRGCRRGQDILRPAKVVVNDLSQLAKTDPTPHAC